MIKQALAGIQIKEATDSQLGKTLAAVYLFIGLRPIHFPTIQEEVFIMKFIRDEYGLKTLDELVFAFKLAIKGDLDLEDHQVYDQFTCEYVARVMTAYRKWIKEINSKIIPVKEQIEIKKEEVTQEEILEIARGCLKYDWRLIPVRAYTILYNQGMRVTEEEKAEIKKTVGALLQDMEQKDPGLYSGTTKEDTELRLCKVLAVRNYLTKNQ